MKFLGKVSFLKNVKTRKFVILGVPLLLPLFYVGGYISQLIENYQSWSMSGGVIGDGTTPSLPSSEIFYCLHKGFTPSGLKCVIVLIIGATTIVALLCHNNAGNGYDKERNFHYSEKGTYGTAGYMNIDSMKKLIEISDIYHTKGTILGILENNIASIPPKTMFNKHIAVFGASGTMKSRAFVRNMIFQIVLRGESIILTDPKSELFEDMSVYLEENGYMVKVFNLVNPQNSDAWNCLGEIGQDEIMAQICADVIIKNTSNGKSDHFWDMSELNLLKALILYVNTEKPKVLRNIENVYKMIAELTEKELDDRFNVLPKGHPAKSPYNIFKQAGEKVRGGVIIGLGVRLQVFQSKRICEMTSCNDIDLTLPGRKKCAYFCISSDQDSTFDFLASLFFSFLFIRLVRCADGKYENGRLPIEVNFVLDEAPNIGEIPDFNKKISTVRGRNINVAIIFQNLAQLKNRYPNDVWQEIIGNCDTQISLGCTDEMTAKYLSDRAGEVTVAINSRSKQLNTWRISDYTPEYKETSSVGRRKLFTQDEILRMPLDEALIILRGQNVFKVKKFDYTLHPESKKLKKRKVFDYEPEWRKQKEHFIESEQELKEKTNTIQHGKENFSKEFIAISKKELMSKNKEEKKHGI